MSETAAAPASHPGARLQELLDMEKMTLSSKARAAQSPTEK